MHGACKPPGPKELTMVITMAKLCMAHASRLGQKRKKVGENNGQLRFVRHHRWHTQAAWTNYNSLCQVLPAEYHFSS